MIGRGPRHARVKAEVVAQRLTNVSFKDHQPRNRLGESLGVPDVHLSVLLPRFERLVHPSKLYGIMAAGRPTIFVGDLQGQTAAMLRDCGAGVSVQSGDSRGLAEAILAMRENDAVRRRMGSAAREAFDRLYAMPIALERWHDLLQGLQAKPAR
jgi:colanic acid biosynthesis glycosyl transferase WcaI